MNSLDRTFILRLVARVLLCGRPVGSAGGGTFTSGTAFAMAAEAMGTAVNDFFAVAFKGGIRGAADAATSAILPIFLPIVCALTIGACACVAISNIFPILFPSGGGLTATGAAAAATISGLLPSLLPNDGALRIGVADSTLLPIRFPISDCVLATGAGGDISALLPSRFPNDCALAGGGGAGAVDSALLHTFFPLNDCDLTADTACGLVLPPTRRETGRRGGGGDNNKFDVEFSSTIYDAKSN